jgi:hypothetical protein
VAVTVTPAPPSAAPDAYAVTAGTTLTVAAPGVLANDVDPQGLPLAASLVAGPAHGALVLQASGAFSYQPAAGYAGPDAFSYQAGNGTTASVVVTVTLTVTQPVNQPPLARDDAASTRAGTAVTISVLANDVDPEGALVAGSVTVVAKPKNGSVTRTSNGALVYTPARRFTGTDLFTYTVSDAAGARSNVATVRVTVR